MKRFITVLSSLLVLPAFAEVAPVYYDDFIEYSDDVIDDEEMPLKEEQKAPSAAKNVQQRQTINRSTATSRAISSATNNASQRTNTSTRAVASSPRTTTSSRGTASRTAKTAAVKSRIGTTVKSRNAETAKPVTARVNANNSVMAADRYGNRVASASEQKVLRTTNEPLYQARIGVSNRRAAARASSSGFTTTASSPVITEEDVKTTTDNLTALAELTDYCKAQYAACMDNYCNVLDDNQGRCTCSKNIKNYEKTEETLTKATEEFQNVVQKIRYIGLSKDQIESLFAETEAELSMKTSSDTSNLKNNLDSIKKKIVDISSPNAGSYDTAGISLDFNGLLNADFTSGFDINSFLGNNTNNTSNVSNQRGEQLYKTATNRCRTAVLNSCVSQGINANVITNSYDLEIDKQCIAYERNLNEANTEMRNNVINATNILQQARLLLTQNKNSYDFRGCVAAIDSCMQDEYVCGSDYELCLDPTGKYIANGEIIKGGTPGVSGGQNKNPVDITPAEETWTSSSGNQAISSSLDDWTSQGMYYLYSAWNYTDKSSSNKNAWGAGSSENLGEYIDIALDSWKTNYKNSKDKTEATDMATYLLQKIGYIDSDNKVHGMCASVMKQCQDYTYTTNKKNSTYLPANEVVRQYLSSTLAKIKAQQDTILSDYAEDCRSDVQSCLSTNGYDSSNPKTTASKTAVNSCASEITTCMSVGGYQMKDGVKLALGAMTDWVASILIVCPKDTYLADDLENGTVSCELCPQYQVYYYNTDAGENDSQRYLPVKDDSGNEQKTLSRGTSAGGQVSACSCPDNFTYFTYSYTVDNTTTSIEGCLASSSTPDSNTMIKK